MQRKYIFTIFDRSRILLADRDWIYGWQLPILSAHNADHQHLPVRIAMKCREKCQ